jgi:hypothetical protein
LDCKFYPQVLSWLIDIFQIAPTNGSTRWRASASQ